MKVILQKDIIKKGKKNQIVDVAAGYAQNFLFPNDYALPATPQNIKRLKSILEQQKVKNAAALDEAKKLRDKINAITLEFTLVQHKEKVAKAISTKQLVDTLRTEHAINIDKRKFVEHDPLNSAGRYIRHLKLADKVIADLHINIKAVEK